MENTLECHIFFIITLIIGYYPVDIQGQGQVTDWNCPTPVSEVYTRINTNARFQFDVSENLPQQANDALSFIFGYYNGTTFVIIRYMSDGSSTTQVLPGFTVTASSSGVIDITLSGVTQNRKGTYRIYVGTDTYACSCLYILGSPTKPNISKSSNPSLGGSARLTCTSTSTTSPSNHSLSFVYSWRVGNEENPTNPRYSYSNNKNTLTLSNLVKGDAGKQFTCLATEDVSGGYSSSVSDAVSLNIRYPPDGPPVITGYTDGGEYRVITGTQGQLTCSVSGGNPAPSLTWHCINSGSTSQSVSSGTITKTHSWMAAQGQDKTCTCRASYYSGHSDVSIRITVLYPPSKPTFRIGSTTVSGTIKVIQNNQLIVTCSSEGQPTPSYKWTYPNGVSITDQNLTVSNVQNGRYTCEVQNTLNPSAGPSEGPKSNSSKFDVEILSPPSVPTFKYWNATGEDIPSGSLDVIKDDTFKVACVSTGNPTPLYHWKNTENNQILTVSSIHADQSKTCTARNTMVETVGDTLTRSATASVTINVFNPPSDITVKYHNGQNLEITASSTLSIIEDEPFKVICSSDGDPPPSYRWTGNITSSSAIVEVSSTRKSHAGNTTCIAENTMTRTFANPEKTKTGRTSRSFILNVLYPPVIGNLMNSSAVEGSSFTKSCPVTKGNPSVTTFEWSRDGRVWKRDQRFTIVSTSRKDAMSYTCEIYNIMEQTGEQPVSRPEVKSFFLDVLYNSTVTEFYVIGHEGETTVTVNETAPVSFVCNVDSNPGSTIVVVKDEVLKLKQTNIKSVTYNNGRAKCTDGGSFSGIGFNDYNERNSTKSVRLFVNCKPRPSPFMTLKENVTSALHVPAMLSFTALAYPEPAESDYKWYRWDKSDWALLSDSEEFQIDTSNLQTNLTVVNVNHTYFGMYKVEVENDFGNYEQPFHLSPQDKPDSPIEFRTVAEYTEQTAFTVRWTPGSSNGLPQTFILRYKKASDAEWKVVVIPDSGKQSMNFTVNNLLSGTSYHVVLYATNELGNSTETEVLTVNTKGDQKNSPPSALIGGAVGGGASFALLVVGGFFLIRKLRNKKGKTDGTVELNGRKMENQDDDSSGDEVVENAMYESAGAVGEKKPVIDNVYAKPQKKVVPSNDVYAVVNKETKKSARKKKAKADKNKAVTGDIYENAPNTAVGKGGKPYRNNAYEESPYEIQDEINSKHQKNNKDGLIYADLVFNDQSKGQKKLVIHGLDNMTEYAEVDITKRADPLPDSDAEDENSKSK